MKSKKLIIDHFKGVSDVIPRGRQRPSYSRRVSGVIDRPGGNMSRLFGMISATTGPHPSIWSLAQLRFRDRWDLLLHTGDQRILYEQDLSPWGIEITPVVVPDLVPIVTPLPVEYPEDTGGYDPRPPPSVCHSWWDIQYGRWKEADIADITFYFSTRGTLGLWCDMAGGSGSCSAAVQGALQNVVDHTPSGWLDWSAACPPTWAPNVASNITLNSWGWCAVPPPPCAKATYAELRWTVRSATLAATNPFTYSGVIIRCGTMVMDLKGGLGSSIGNDWWGQVPTRIGGVDTNRSADMIYYDVGRSDICASILAGGGYSCPGAPPAFTNTYRLSTGSCTPDEAYFYNYGGRYVEHTSCFEEK